MAQENVLEITERQRQRKHELRAFLLFLRIAKKSTAIKCLKGLKPLDFTLVGALRRSDVAPLRGACRLTPPLRPPPSSYTDHAFVMPSNAGAFVRDQVGPGVMTQRLPKESPHSPSQHVTTVPPPSRAWRCRRPPCASRISLQRARPRAV